MSAALAQLTDEIAADVLSRVADGLLAKLEERALAKQPDPLMTIKEASAYLSGQGSRIGETTLRQLVEAGELHRAPGLLEIRIRRSVLDAYGKPKPRK